MDDSDRCASSQNKSRKTKESRLAFSTFNTTCFHTTCFLLTTESRFYLEAKSRQFPDVYACNRSGHKVSHETVSEQMRQLERANHRITEPGHRHARVLAQQIRRH